MLNFEVSDTGIGIDEDDMNIMFTRFGKYQRTAEMNSEGLGLGLVIVRKICESYGGELVV